MRDYLKEAVEAIKANGLPVIEVIEETDITDASINLTPKWHIQMCSPVEYCLVEQVSEEEWQYSNPVDLQAVIRMARASLARPAAYPIQTEIDGRAVREYDCEVTTEPNGETWWDYYTLEDGRNCVYRNGKFEQWITIAND